MTILIIIAALCIIITFMHYYSKSENWMFKNLLILSMMAVAVVAAVLINDLNELQELLMNL